MNPTLLLQVQRMGDLVLTFPLMARLLSLEPERPLWVMAEPKFYEQLMPLTPSGVTYMPPSMTEAILKRPLHRVINLSHRDVAVDLAGQAIAETRVGLHRSAQGVLRTSGKWALYRASLAYNNRHNQLHWADLNTFDVLPPEALNLPIWPRPNAITGSGRVGLFVGASECEKRPDPAFWGELARVLAKRGASPVFLGGPDDRPLAIQAARLAGLPTASNLAGNFTVSALVAFFRTLDLVVTPDTGPMHVSAWTGVLTLNLSMGPVNPWETAPASPGHFVLRPTLSCTGCWKCANKEPRCRSAFVPGRVAGLIMALLHNSNPEHLSRLSLPRLSLCRTGRADNLFSLQPLQSTSAPHLRDLFGRFWKQWFLSVLGGAPQDVASAREQLFKHSPMQSILARETAQLAAALSRECRKREGSALRQPGFWQHTAPAIRPLSGYIQMLLQNGDYSDAALHEALELIGRM